MSTTTVPGGPKSDIIFNYINMPHKLQTPDCLNNFNIWY